MTLRRGYPAAFLAALLLHAALLAALGRGLPGRRMAPAAAPPAAAPLTVRLLPAFRPAAVAAPAAAAAAPAGHAAPRTAEPALSVPQPVPAAWRAEPLPAAAAATGGFRRLPAVERIKPQLTYALNPVFPLGARLRGEEGDARVRVTLAASGRIEAVELLESSGFAALDRSALKAARQGRFAPARLGGRPVAGELVIRIRFRLQES